MTDTTMPTPNVIPAETWRYAVSTYRYLRLSIVIVVVTLGVSLGEQIVRESCVQGSVSAFYYTPVHSVFIAALGLTGVALIAIRGSGWLRESLLNVAGLLAPVVAFIPTSRPEDKHCALNDAIGSIPQRFTSNNLTAFGAGAVLTVVVAVLGALRARKVDRWAALVRRETVLPASLLGMGLAALLAWHHFRPESFKLHAHSYSAIAMFGFVGGFVALTAKDAQRQHLSNGQTPAAGATTASHVPTRLVRSLYWLSLGLMALGVMVWFIADQAGWYYTVFAVEAIETLAFLVFWATQSYDLWDVGVLATPAPASTTAPAGTIAVAS